MMVLQIISKKSELLNEIAEFLLEEELIANAIISEGLIVKTKNDDGLIANSKEFSLKAISKSLLFNDINKKIRDKFKEQTPLIYSEPIILIDQQYREELLNRMTKV